MFIFYYKIIEKIAEATFNTLKENSIVFFNILYLGTKKLDPQYISISNGLLYITAWQRIKPESCAYNAGCIIVYGTDGNAQKFIDTDAQSYLNLSVPEGKKKSSYLEEIIVEVFLFFRYCMR